MSKIKGVGEKPAIALLEESVDLLRAAPPALLAAYYSGTLPYLLGLLYFWSDMSRGALADTRLLAGSLGLAALYVWMKIWHAVFASGLARIVAGSPPRPWRLDRVLGMILTQATLQPLGLLLRPLALLAAVPYAWVAAFFHNVSVLGDGLVREPGKVAGRALVQTWLWPRQNHIALGLVLAACLPVAINVAAVVFVAPWFLKTFLGIETVFSMSLERLLNTTFLAAVVLMSWAVLDPVLKAFYALRCFAGQSLATGDDLVADWRFFRRGAGAGRVARAAAVAALLVVVAAPARVAAATDEGAPEEPVSKLAGMGFPGGATSPLPALEKGSQELAPPVARRGSGFETDSDASPLAEPSDPAAREIDRAIAEVLSRPEFTWRFPRSLGRPEDQGVIERFVEDAVTTVKKWMRPLKDWFNTLMDRLGDWLRRRQMPELGAGGSLNWPRLALGLLYGLAGVLLIALLWFVWRVLRGGRIAKVVAQPVVAVPDLASEDLVADALPEDDWRKLGDDMLAKGELRLALRAFFLSGLAHLGGRNMVGLARHKTNRDYLGEVGRRAREAPDIVEAFRANVNSFEAVWYGDHQVTPSVLEGFGRQLERIRSC